jgi:hypothetical protein
MEPTTVLALHMVAHRDVIGMIGMIVIGHVRDRHSVGWLKPRVSISR